MESDMTIVCLGWGSLLWDPRELPLASEWRHDGPELPIEFARQSADGRITLVIDTQAAPLKVFSADLGVVSLVEAQEALAARENITSRYLDRSVGHWSPSGSSGHKECEVVEKWASDTNCAGVVWTALKPKFNGAFVPPTCAQVVDYLEGLEGETRSEAERYIRRTPGPIRTAFRDEIERALGWMPIE